MDASQLANFNRQWKERWTLMTGQHWDDCRQAKVESETRKKSAIENARLQEASLSHGADSPAALKEKKRKIHEECEAALKSIDKQCDEVMRLIKENQLKEEENHHKAYAEALARKSLVASALSVQGPAPATTTLTTPTTTAATVATASTTGTTGGVETAAGEGADMPSTCQSLPAACRSTGSPADPIPPAEHATLAPAAAQEKHQLPITISEKSFSVAVQREFAADGKEQYVLRYKTKNRKALCKALRDSTASQAELSTSVDPAEPLPIPGPMNTTISNEYSPPKTVTFDEVYRNGQAKHKDTIVEYPQGCNQWYILKCEEHAIRFNRNPIPGAAKHLNGRLHNYIPKSSAKAIQMLGYQVIDCNAQLADLNNAAVNQAYANGYRPISIINPEHKKSRPKQITTPDSCRKIDTTNIQQGEGVPSQTNTLESSRSTPSQRACSIPQMVSREIITNPKAFHVYYCFWSADRSFYPVMILGWDDQRPGGLEHGLGYTGLLDKKQSNVPSCYIYKDPESATNAAIAGWSPGFEDGGPKVNQRKFPVMFFDEDSNVSWVSARSLSRFPLYEPAPSKKEDHPFNAARRWIAKKEGFTSWEEFEKARQKNAPGTKAKPSFPELRSGSVTTPLVSPITDSNNPFDNSETDTSTQSSASNITEEELRAMQDTAGEIAGDGDYTGSDVDSTLGNEYEEWDSSEADGRPWAFYGLRNVECTKNGNLNPTHRNNPDTTARTREDAKETLEALVEDNDAKSSSSTPMTSQNVANVINHAAPLLKGETVSSAQVVQDVDENRADGSLPTHLHTSTDLPSAPPPPPPSALPEPEEVLRVLKRERCEEVTETNRGTPRQGHAKKAKLAMDAAGDEAAEPAVPGSPAAHSLTPIVVSGPAAFELSFYRKGPVWWRRESEEISVGLYHQKGDRKVASAEGLLNIVIDPTELRGFSKEEIRRSNGNYMVTLLPLHPHDHAAHIVFDRAKGSKGDIGKIQLRSFIRWLWDINPNLPLLDNPGEAALAQ
ncbi:hypothetical protein F5Y01DRAFT_212530 [Xylaria sp. FL0043]|nr:hypothetical protein F5Y01DRAFT_212530 [Xylaria sp. FL0043]